MYTFLNIFTSKYVCKNETLAAKMLPGTQILRKLLAESCTCLRSTVAVSCNNSLIQRCRGLREYIGPGSKLSSCKFPTKEITAAKNFNCATKFPKICILGKNANSKNFFWHAKI